MKNHSAKLKRVIACLLAAVMVISQLAVAPATFVSAAPKKYVKSLKVSKANVALESGDKVTVKATVAVKGGANKKVKVSLPSAAKKAVSVKVGKVNKKGVTALTIKGKNVAKKTTVSVKIVTSGKNKKKKNISKTIKVTVKPKQIVNQEGIPTVVPIVGPIVTEAPTVSQVKVAVPEESLVVGDTTTAKATVVPAGVSTTITWTSSNDAVATVDTEGNIVAMGAGNAVITATAANGVSGTVTITVKAVSVTGVKLNSKSVNNMAVGNTTTLVATVEPTNATDRRISWSSTNEEVATVTSEGVVTALKAGEADIVVETKDGGFKSTCHIKVADSSTADVDKIEATVQNAIEGYPNTVLVGTRAQIRVTVTKDGVPFGNDTVALDLKGVSGYYGYYELEKDTIDLNQNGTGTAYIKLKQAYSDSDVYNATIDDAKNWSDAAYASLKLTVRAGGADLVQEVPITFGQIMVGNDLSLYSANTPAITVDNYHDSEFVNPIEGIVEGGKDVQITSAATADEQYYEEYVVDQQVSTTGKDHSIELDASPLLILPSAEDTTSKGNYEKKIDYTSGEYSVYSGVESAYTIKDVPGGLQYLTLSFSQIKLSPYTKLVIGCYEADTNFPIEGAEIKKENIETKDGRVETINIPKSIFEELDATDKMDIKVYVESAGQVDEDTNIGFTLTKVEGPYKNTTRKELTVERLTKYVTWSIEEITYSTSEVLRDTVAREYLGKEYVADYTYEIQYPTYPATGNAIITAKDANDKEKTYYLYPTEAVNNDNVLLQGEEEPSKYLIPATIEEIKTLQKGNYTAVVNERGNYVIDSKKAGIVNVKADISTYGGVEYTVHSSVQWSAVSTEQEETSTDYYAIAGQTVELEVLAMDDEGNPSRNAEITWEYDTGSVITTGANDKTNEQGKAVLTLKSNEAVDLERISVKTKSHVNLEFYVANQKVTSDYANIYWIKPGIYYKDKIDGNELSTIGANGDVTALNTTYAVGKKWILGTKVVGFSASKEVTNITNIKINMSHLNDGGADVEPTEKSNGVWILENIVKGGSTEKFTLDGYIDGNRPCEITVMEDEEEVVYTSVGTGEVDNGKGALVVPVTWSPSGANLSILTASGTSFDISNEYGGKLHVYLKVQDIYQNAVVGQEVTYAISSEEGNTTGVIVTETSVNTDENGMVDIAIDAPKTACKYTVSASINDEKPLSQTFNFKAVASNEFTIDADVTKGQNKTLILSSNSQMDASILNEGMFTLTDNGQTISIDEIKAGSSAEKIIIKTKETFSSDLKIEYKPITVDAKTGQIFYLLNANGTLYSNGND